MPGLTPEQAAALLTGAAKPKPAVKPAAQPRRHAFEPGPGGACRRCRHERSDAGWHYVKGIDTRKWGVNAPF